jgi:CDP-paratose 2-epimerase
VNAGRLLITGGAGFVGVNAADHFTRAGWQVTLFDNLSRAGTERNLDWIRAEHPEVTHVLADVRDAAAVESAVAGQDAIIHLAAQVAVTTSLLDPLSDFEVNARGTLNVLEACRKRAPEAALVFASTNKVYGKLEGVTKPVDESRPLDFHSPYGCSKGAADQYVRDYARCYGMRTVVFRESCIYGLHQYGTEDQGWVAHFMHAIARRRPITIYGDGTQVRDLLNVSDLCRLYERALESIDRCQGEAFNIGGGADNARSVLQVLHLAEELLETPARFSFSDWREGDQRYFVADASRATQVLGWRPEVGADEGLERLASWVRGVQGD